MNRKVTLKRNMMLLHLNELWQVYENDNCSKNFYDTFLPRFDGISVYLYRCKDNPSTIEVYSMDKVKIGEFQADKYLVKHNFADDTYVPHQVIVAYPTFSQAFKSVAKNKELINATLHGAVNDEDKLPLWFIPQDDCAAIYDICNFELLVGPREHTHLIYCAVDKDIREYSYLLMDGVINTDKQGKAQFYFDFA